MAHPSSRLFSCNKVIVHRIAWNGWYISSSKSKEIKCNKQHLLPATKPFFGSFRSKDSLASADYSGIFWFGDMSNVNQ